MAFISVPSAFFSRTRASSSVKPSRPRANSLSAKRAISSMRNMAPPAWDYRAEIDQGT
jgi:hypothetical protein